MSENVALVDGPREIDAIGTSSDVDAQPTPAHAEERLRGKTEDVFEFSFRIKPDRRSGPIGFDGSERRRHS